MTEVGGGLGASTLSGGRTRTRAAEAEARHVQQLEQSETGRVSERQEQQAQAERLAGQQGRLVATRSRVSETPLCIG